MIIEERIKSIKQRKGKQRKRIGKKKKGLMGSNKKELTKRNYQ